MSSALASSLVVMVAGGRGRGASPSRGRRGNFFESSMGNTTTLTRNPAKTLAWTVLMLLQGIATSSSN